MYDVCIDASPFIFIEITGISILVKNVIYQRDIMMHIFLFELI